MTLTTPGITPGQLASCDAAALVPSPPEAAKVEPVAPAPSCADDITQQGLQAAQRSLTEASASDIDAESVGQMQALLASPQFSIDADALASAMLDFFSTGGA